jgi:hypothetical protein
MGAGTGMSVDTDAAAGSADAACSAARLASCNLRCDCAERWWTLSSRERATCEAGKRIKGDRLARTADAEGGWKVECRGGWIVKKF